MDKRSSPDIAQRLRNFCVWNNRQSHYEPVPLCQEAAVEIERLRAVAATPSEPVAWRCRDYADGWIYTSDKKSAESYRETTGCLMQPLYVEPQPVDVSPDAKALGYATRLLTSFVAEHFPHNSHWKPQTTLIGVLTQLDNATTIARDYKEKLRGYEGSAAIAPDREAPTERVKTEMLALADEFEGEAKAHRAMGERGEYAKCLRAAYALRCCADAAQPSPDQERLDWLQGRITDTIYLDDGKIIDVRGNNVREAIDAAICRWPGSLEDEEGAASITSTQRECKFPNCDCPGSAMAPDCAVTSPHQPGGK
jgi:hypothetical protein